MLTVQNSSGIIALLTNELEQNKMSTFQRSIGNCTLNGIGFDLYENKNGSAAVRPVNRTVDFPRKHWLTFDSLAAAERSIDSAAGVDTEGAQRVRNLKRAWLD